LPDTAPVIKPDELNRVTNKTKVILKKQHDEDEQ
jgi:hypothetical protein